MGLHDAKPCSTLLMSVLIRKEPITRSKVGAQSRNLRILAWLTSTAEWLDFFVGNFQCKHIILGVCHDAGYGPYLGRFAADLSINDRITLLEGRYINRRIASLGFKKHLKLDTVFTANNVVAIPALPSTSTSPPAAARQSSATPVLRNPADLSNRLEIILNEAGQRVDKTLSVHTASPYLNILRQNKLCGWYYLRGECKGPENNCGMNHAPPPLNAREFDCLWYLARQGMCYKVRKGKDVCVDPKCIYGHEEGNPIGSGTGAI